MSNILIVEDSSIISRHLMIFLQSNGFNVIGRTATGEESVEQAKSLNPDLILMDVMLDGNLNGIEASKKIREFSEAPIIFMSALTDNDSMESFNSISKSKRAGKPFIESELLRTINFLLGKAQE